MSQTSFLFQLDSARDNDEFLTLRGKRLGATVYRGAAMKVGPGWIPDYLEVTTDDKASVLHLTLIELESTESVARVSCRKYIPENSAAVVEAFSQYLDAVLTSCRATADARLETLLRLKQLLSASASVIVETAGALRTSADFLEVFPLLDQPDGSGSQAAPQYASQQSALRFAGNRPFSREEVDGLLRVVHVLHAVVVGKDHGGGKLKGWRFVQRKVLLNAISPEPNRFPELTRLTSSYTRSGARFDCDRVCGELAVLWAGARMGLTSEQVRVWITAFHPIVVAFPAHEPMPNVFEEARRVVAI